MKTCEDCIHCCICMGAYGMFLPVQVCDSFKDQSKFIELPCAIGDTVYMITTGHDDWTGYDFKTIIKTSFRLDMLNSFNKRFFLTREEAEKKLEELNGQI